MLKGDTGQTVQTDVDRQAFVSVVVGDADALDVIFEDFGRRNDCELHKDVSAFIA